MVGLFLAGGTPARAASVVLRADTASPLSDELQKLIPMPDFLLLSDGTVFFGRPGHHVGEIEYYTAHMSKDEMDSLVGRLQLSHVADWDDDYHAATLADLPTTTYTLNVPSVNRTISVYGAAYSAHLHVLPDGLTWLYDYISSFREDNEQPFVPTKATLYVKTAPALTVRHENDTPVLRWTVRDINLEKVTGIGDYRPLVLTSPADVQAARGLLRGAAWPTMLAPKVLFQYKKDYYHVAIRPVLPGE